MADRLKRLLETETELDALLEETKQRAEKLVETARADAEERVRRHEHGLQLEEESLRQRLVDERNRMVADVRSQAALEVQRLDGLPEETILELAQHIVARLIWSRSGGAP